MARAGLHQCREVVIMIGRKRSSSGADRLVRRHAAVALRIELEVDQELKGAAIGDTWR